MDNSCENPRSFIAFSSATHDSAQQGEAAAQINRRPRSPNAAASENTTLERRVLAHERILHAPIVSLAGRCRHSGAAKSQLWERPRPGRIRTGLRLDRSLRRLLHPLGRASNRSDDEFPNGAVAMSLTAAELLAQNRADATTEGRLVLALESIADQLKEVVSLLAVPAREQTSPACQMPQSTDRWENEGGSLEALSSIPPGVVRHTEETFTVGSHRYTNLADADAEVARSGKRGQS